MSKFFLVFFSFLFIFLIFFHLPSIINADIGGCSDPHGSKCGNVNTAIGPIIPDGQHLVKRILKNGWTLSIPTNMVRLQQLQDNVAMADISQITTETDGPFLSPHKDIQVNEPRFIIESLRKIAEIKKINLEEASEQIYKNYKRIYER